MIYWCVKNCILEEDNIPESAFCLAVKIQFLFSVSVIQLSRSENLQTTLESDWIRRMSQNDAVAIRELPTVYHSNNLRWTWNAPEIAKCEASSGIRRALIIHFSTTFASILSRCLRSSGWMYFAWEVKTNWRIFTLRCRSVSEVM